MSRRASPSAIGAFVVGAIALAVVGVGVFGSGRFFRDVEPYVLYFSGDVNGLNEGAPVKFKGVEIGTVRSVLLSASSMSVFDNPEDVRIPVIIELDAGNLAQKGSKVTPDPATIKLLIDNGLRAQLAMESIVTGLLYVKLNLYPESPLRLVNDPTVEYPEIPTLPTPLEEVQMRASRFITRLEETDLVGLFDSIRTTFDGASELFNSPGLKGAVNNLDEVVGNLEKLTASLTETVERFGSLAHEADARLVSVSGQLETTLSDIERTSAEARQTLKGVQGFVAPDSPVLYQLAKTLDDVAASASALRRLAENLERNPSALVRGKAQSEGRE